MVFLVGRAVHRADARAVVEAFARTEGLDAFVRFANARRYPNRAAADDRRAGNPGGNTTQNPVCQPPVPLAAWLCAGPLGHGRCDPRGHSVCPCLRHCVDRGRFRTRYDQPRLGCGCLGRVGRLRRSPGAGNPSCDSDACRSVPSEVSRRGNHRRQPDRLLGHGVGWTCGLGGAGGEAAQARRQSAVAWRRFPPPRGAPCCGPAASAANGRHRRPLAPGS